MISLRGGRIVLRRDDEMTRLPEVIHPGESRLRSPTAPSRRSGTVVAAIPVEAASRPNLRSSVLNPPSLAARPRRGAISSLRREAQAHELQQMQGGLFNGLPGLH